MALSGKAPAPEPLLEDELAAWGVAGAGAGGAGAGGGEGAAAPGAAGRTAASRRWSVAFHSEFNIAGVQPTLLVPQVTGDVIRLHTHVGGVLLPAPLPRTRLRPRPLLSQRTVDYLLPPQVGWAPRVCVRVVCKGGVGPATG